MDYRIEQSGAELKIFLSGRLTFNDHGKVRAMIQEMVRKNFGNCTVLTIAHRLHSIMDSSRVMVFDAGRLMEMDAPITLIDAGTTIFNSLVQQSGCAGELRRLALGETSIAETLQAQDKNKDESTTEEEPVQTITPAETVILN